MLKVGSKVTWKGSDDVKTVVKIRTSRLNGSNIVTVRDETGDLFDVSESNLTPVDEDEEDKVTLTRSDFYGIVADVETMLFGEDDD